ncbi:hypothetical protein [Brevundimonas sp.]|uniref:hypothetical protein n=1 Tax=Brevundimonas sp. TaxID=1871086 RepID=UPI002BD5C576|nr:hypothetical protein [Brevundimonas sp.]HWQ87723.1 hypothetical protein [Brevundimonas sp.]
MTDLIRALNPTAPITTESEAIDAARASALAIFLGVLWGIVGVIYLMTAGQAVMEAAVAQASAQNPEAAGMAGAMAQTALWMSVGLVVIQAILGFVQWTKPNIVIPIIFAILVAFGLVSGLLSLAMAGQAGMPETVQAPMWQVWGGFIVMAVQLLMHINGIRGARKLDKLRFDAAQTY